MCYFNQDAFDEDFRVVGGILTGYLMRVSDAMVQEQICASIISLYTQDKVKHYGDGESVQNI